MAVSTHLHSHLASLTHRTKLFNSSCCTSLFPNAKQTSPSTLCSAVLSGHSTVSAGSKPPFSSFNELIESLIDKKDLSESESEAAMEFLLSDTNEALISAFLSSVVGTNRQTRGLRSETQQEASAYQHWPCFYALLAAIQFGLPRSTFSISYSRP